jgi:hypothetical protein
MWLLYCRAASRFAMQMTAVATAQISAVTAPFRILRASITPVPPPASSGSVRANQRPNSSGSLAILAAKIVNVGSNNRWPKLVFLISGVRGRGNGVGTGRSIGADCGIWNCWWQSSMLRT